MNDNDITLYCSALSPQVCGPNMEYEPDFLKIEELAAGTPETQAGNEIVASTPPDWRKVLPLAEKLMAQSRDLRLVVYWTVARMERDVLTGLIEGLQLILKLSEDFWQELWPIPDDGDVIERMSALRLLSPEPNGFDSNMVVLNMLQEYPLCQSRAMGQYGRREIELGSLDAQLVKAAFLDTPVEVTEKSLAQLQEAIDCIKNIRACYDEHQMGTPDFTLLMDALKSMKSILQSYTVDTVQTQDAASSQETPSVEASPADNPFAPAAIPASPAVASSAPLLHASLNTQANRQELVETLRSVIDWFKANEPSNPAPYFIERAIRCVGANFMEIINDVLPQGRDVAENILKPNAQSAEMPPTQTPSLPQQMSVAPSPAEFNPFG